MKVIGLVAVLALIASAGSVLAQSGDMKNMDMKGMDMKSMPMDRKAPTGTHKAIGIVKQVDPIKGVVTLAHEPIKSLNWPAMTMSFAVKDKALIDKLQPGEKAEVELSRQGKDYVITSVK